MTSHIPSRMSGTLLKVSIFLLSAVAMDCVPLTSNIAIRPSECYRYRHSSIEIRTHDGRLIRFPANRFTVIERANGIELEGKGKLYRQGGVYVGKAFEGRIRGSEIEQIAIIQNWDPGRMAAILGLMSILFPLAYYGI